jgi:hypothetical protein
MSKPRSKNAPLRRTSTHDTPTVFEPRHPTLAATACMTLWIAILSIPMLSGAFVAAPYNDQYSSGYAYRTWAAEWWKRLGHIPLWNPEILGGLPFIGATHGDVLYPTAWLRLVLPTHIAMDLGFATHYVLAGLFMYWFLRRWNVSWTGAVVGGLSYQLSGVIGSYVSPGHDGKLFVTAMLPLLLTGLTFGIRDRRFAGYALAAFAVGLIMLSPHPQMGEFALLAAGIYTLFLVFGNDAAFSTRERLGALALALLAVVVGVGVSAAQYLPFYAYIPYSPRAATVLSDFDWSAAYAIPWVHVPEFVIPRFTGESFHGTYWGPNGTKLHSEYLGLLVVALAVVGIMDSARRRMIAWMLGIAALFLLIALGSATPFFHFWWEHVPFAKSTRAAGMALFVVCFVTATLAAFGTDRIVRGQTPRFAKTAMIVGGTVALLGIAGLFGVMAESLAAQTGAAMGLPNHSAIGAAAAATVRWSSLVAGLALALAGLVMLLRARATLSTRGAAFALVGLVGTDLWLNARAFWVYSRAPEELFAGDAIKARLHTVPKPYRVWDVEVLKQRIPTVYPGSALMADDIPQLYGHHGNEPHTFDVLNAREDPELAFDREGDPRILELFAVNYLIIHAQIAPDSIPGFVSAVTNVATSSGATATLFERNQPIAYARFVPAAAAYPRIDRAVEALLAPDFPVDRVVLIDSVPGTKPESLPNPLPAAINDPIIFDDWIPGRMRIHLTSAAPSPGYVVVSENWDRGWRATVDGKPAAVLRGDATLITVPIMAGARNLELRYESPEYERGRLISLMSLLVIAVAGIAPLIAARRRA